MLDALLWYLVISILGLITFPLAFHLLPGLPDRGYTLSRTLGLLLWGYIFWLLNSLGWLYNNQGGILLGVFLLAGASVVLVWRGGWQELRSWIANNRGLILASELLFLAAFVFIAFVRSANPEIVATEKPMELAFINAILRSPSFPPHDPWLSGYAISYYYFGYILVAMLAQLLGTTGGVAFNLGISLVFALSALGAFGIVYNLLRKLHPLGSRITLIFHATLGPLFLLLVSNVEGLLEVLHARGLFWSVDAQGNWTSPFWTWLGIKDLNMPPAQPLSWLPTRYLWWWRASRVVQDFKLTGEPIEIIDEFPFFSYLLADLHPHVLAMPFAILAVGLALNLIFGGALGRVHIWRFSLRLNAQALVLGMLVFGGMAFLNIWDFPIYVALFAGAFIIYQVRRLGWAWDRLFEFLGLAFLLGIGGVILYLPFYLGFQSQAGGVLPNVVNPTRGAQLWVMFATLLLPLLAYLVYLGRHWLGRPRLKFGLLAALGLVAFLFAFSLGFAILISFLPVLGSLFLNNLGASSLANLVQAAFSSRLISFGGWLTLLLILAGCLALLRAVNQAESAPLEAAEDGVEAAALPHWSSHLFAVLLITIAALLVLAPDFIYLRDLFNTRMNTVFKFYYAAWLMWALAAAYGSAVLLNALQGIWAWVYRIGLAVILLVGLIYPVLGLNTKTNGFRPASGFTLDGTQYFQRQSPDEWAAIQWLQQATFGVVAEAVGGSYSQYARISTNTGLPAVLGWPFHEVQWRGSAKEQGSREGDITRLYCTPDWEEANSIIEQYDIKYIFVGGLELSKFQANSENCPGGLDERKFQKFTDLAFENAGVRIYVVP
jgi:YYY domain-containing protein